MIVRILGNYHHAGPCGGITGDCAREVPMGIAVGSCEKSAWRSVGSLTGCVRCDGGDLEVREYGEAAVDHCGSRHRDSQFGRRNLEFVVLCPGVGVLLGASH